MSNVQCVQGPEEQPVHGAEQVHLHQARGQPGSHPHRHRWVAAADSQDISPGEVRDDVILLECKQKSCLKVVWIVADGAACWKTIILTHDTLLHAPELKPLTKWCCIVMWKTVKLL